MLARHRLQGSKFPCSRAVLHATLMTPIMSWLLDYELVAQVLGCSSFKIDRNYINRVMEDVKDLSRGGSPTLINCLIEKIKFCDGFYLASYLKKKRCNIKLCDLLIKISVCLLFLLLFCYILY